MTDAAAECAASAQEPQLERVVLVHVDRLSPPLIDVVVVDVVARNISQILDLLGSLSLTTLPRLSHLGRVKRDRGSPTARILICDDGHFSTLDETCRTRILQYGAHFIVQVPSCPPMSHVEHQTWRKIWPLSSRAQPPRHNPIDPLTSSTRVRIIELVEGLPRGDLIAASLVDDDGVVVGQAVQRVGNQPNPLDHAVIRVIDVVARANCDKSIASKGSWSQDPYLCRGLDLLVTHEPCAMCTMAALHSRIGRLVYIRPVKRYGACGSQFYIHCDSRLNHRFDAYRFVSPAIDEDDYALAPDGCRSAKQ